jgi:hypothetical protein
MESEKEKNQPSSEQKSSNTSRVGKIDKVDPAKNFNEATGNKWTSIFQKFNPLGTTADMYSKTLAYKIETKRLEAEQKRIEEQAKITHNVLDKSFKLKIEELEQRRLALIGFYETVNRELEYLHIERMTVLKMAEITTNQMLETKDIEEKRLLKEFATELTSQIPIFGANANESLKNLVQTLPQVPPAALIDIAN